MSSDTGSRSVGAEPTLSVIVPVKNGERTLAACLEAILASQTSFPFEVLVVDDGSTDGTAAVAARFPCRVVSLAVNRGPAVARNRGVAEARAPRVMFVDADVFVRPDTLAEIARDLERFAAAFGTYDPVPHHRNFYTLLYHTLSCRSLAHTSETTRVFYSYCAGFRRDLFLELGGFDEGFASPTFEDVELGCRLADRGFLSRHRKDVKVVHAAYYSGRGLMRAYFRKSRDLARLLLSRRSLSFGDEGWTNRKNWLVLACAYASVGLAPLAFLLGSTWVLAWAGGVLGFLLAALPLARGMARWHWSYAPLGVLGYLAIHFIATAAMAAAVFSPRPAAPAVAQPAEAPVLGSRR